MKAENRFNFIFFKLWLKLTHKNVTVLRNIVKLMENSIGDFLFHVLELFIISSDRYFLS